jgi:hypothetical protein
MDKSVVNEAINIFTFNKSKKATIILIHGLFGNSGYWLPFLTHFSEFRILILDINYTKILLENPKKINFHKFLESMLEDDNEYTLISHSMGTVLAQSFSEKKIKISYEICPIKNSVKNNKKKFIKEINSLTNFSKEEIRNILEKATVFLSNNFGVENKSLNKKQYVPRIDLFFNDSFNNDNEEYFEGDHFNIINSISMINKDLSLNK